VSIKAPYYPIIYVRGYAATMSEIEDTVATPYMGFNLGATKLRQNYEDEILRFIFESPLVRLMKDEEYVDAYRNGDFIPETESVRAKSVWIYRYYEPVSKDLGDGERRTLPYFARGLREFILRVRNQVCGDDKQARKAFKVYLVAHSMGGLICRCYLQNICQRGVQDSVEKGSEEDIGKLNRDLGLSRLPADPLVDKVFTYATPHNGIEFAGRNVPDLGSLDKLQVRNFNRTYMREYLALADAPDGRVDSLDGTFPVERFFCLVGTNYRDYEAFFGLSRKGTGPMSDGLVMMENASVRDAPRAFVHRCHSGDYGIVNSEEGYQNLRRFLFGDVHIDVRLLVDEITLPIAIEKRVEEGKSVRAAYNIECAASLRGLNVHVNERRVSQESAIRRTYDKLVHDHQPVYLFSGCLLKSAKTKGSPGTALAFTLNVGMQVPVYELDRKLWLDDHFEGGYVFQETITFHVRPTSSRTTVRYSLASEEGTGTANHLLELEKLDEHRLRYVLPIGFREGVTDKPRPGMRGRVEILASPWNA
jgi:hypothetical protein